MRKIFSLIILALISLDASSQSWSVKLSFDSVSAPQGLINSNFAVSPAIVMNNKGLIAAFLTETNSGMSGKLASKTVLLSSAGKVILETKDLLPESAEIRQLESDANGNFIVSVIEGVRDNQRDKFPNAAIYVFDSQLKQKFKLSLDSVYFPVGIMAVNSNLRICFSAYAGFQILDKKIPGIDEGALQLVTLDWQAGKVLNHQKIGPGDLLNEPAMFASNSDGSFYVIQNTVILKGPDHHDAHIYSFDKQGKLAKHKHLRGSGQLTHLWLRDMQVDKNNDITITGYSDDPVNFNKENVFIRKDPSGKPDSVEQYTFEVKYNSALSMKSYRMLDGVAEKMAAMFPVFPESGVLRNGVKFRSRQGEENTNQPPVLEIYKE